MRREDFLARVVENCSRFISTADFNEKTSESFAARIDYVRVDANQPADFERLAVLMHDHADRVRVFYLSTAPSLFNIICVNLAHANLVTPASRVVLEKPLGRDLASAQLINEQVGAIFEERQIFRIDHYLGKETVQNLIALRFGNACSSRCGPAPGCATCRSRWPSKSAWRAAASSMTAPARRATWCKTICCNCSVFLPWSRPGASTRTRCATRRSRCCGRSSRSRRRTYLTKPYAASIGQAPSKANRCQAIWRSLASPRTAGPRHLWRSKPKSRLGAGPTCRSICAPASAWRSGWRRSWSTSAMSRTTSSGSARPSAIGW